MTFAPDSVIHICCVNFDNTYNHVINFRQPELIEDGYASYSDAQYNYFATRKVKTFYECTIVRGHSPDELSIKVEENIDNLRHAGANYMMYQNRNLTLGSSPNTNPSLRWYYAFITKMEYVSEGVTRLYIEQDIFQTWHLDAHFLPSFVEREHSVTDFVGENIIPEPFNFQDFIYEPIGHDKLDNALSNVGYLIGSSESLNDESVSRGVMAGIFQGVFFYFFDKASNVATFINNITTKSGGDCILFITMIPDFCVNKGNEENNYQCLSSDKPERMNIVLNFNHNNTGLDNWYPVKNNKLFTAPFFQLYVTNHSGTECTYNVEDFDSDADPEYYHNNDKEIVFELYGDVSANPSVTLIPLDYKNNAFNYDEGITISNFPQCSYSTDTYKLWLAKNQYTVASNVASSVVGGIASVLTLNGEGIYNSIQNAVNTANSVYQASMTPNDGHLGNANNNLLTAIRYNKFEFFWKKIKMEYQKVVDDFFTMYGYQTNQVKEPNLNSRPYFNYVKTIGLNIRGSFPTDQQNKFKQIFDKGVTLWKPWAEMCDYSQDNRPT